MKEFLKKSPLLKEFKAVQEGNVYCTTQNLYQDSMKLGTVILDFHNMLTTAEEQNEATFTYLFRLE